MRDGEPARRRRGALAQRSGVEAENAAARRIEQLGLAILARRLRTAVGEIDLLAADDDWLIAVEVKLRRNLRESAEALGKAQSARLLQALDYVLAVYPHWQRPNTRFDVMLVDHAGEIRHVRDALRLF